MACRAHKPLGLARLVMARHAPTKKLFLAIAINWRRKRRFQAQLGNEEAGMGHFAAASNRF